MKLIHDKYTFLFSLLWLLTFFSADIYAQSSRIQLGTGAVRQFTQIGLADGLPNEYVTAIAQDKYGFLWFGTKNGLCRYDGREVKTFYHVPGDSTSLPGNEIQVLFSDSRGNLWVGAYGLNRFNFETENFTRITPPQYDSLTTRLKFVAKICEDNAGSLWLGTFGQGLFKFDPVSGNLEPIDLHNAKTTGFSGTIIYSLSMDDLSDTLWVTSSGKQVTAINTATHEQVRHVLNRRGDIQMILRDRAGRKWLGVMGEPLQQVHLRPSGEFVFTRLENVNIPNFIALFQNGHNGSIWMGTEDMGVFVFNPRRNTIEHYRHHLKNNRSLPGDFIEDIFEDRDGNIWIATNKGVGKWARWEKPFRHYQHDIEQPNSINNSEVTGIDQDEQGRLWISTLNTGFNRFDLQKKRFTRYDPSTCAVKSPWALDILAAHDGMVWIASNFQHGLIRFNTATGEFTEFKHSPQDSGSIASNLVTTLFEDRQGRLWIAFTHKGLDLYQPHSKTFRHFQHDAANPRTLDNNRVNTLYQDSRSFLWIGTANGLNRLDTEKMRFTRYIPSAGRNPDSKSLAVNGICEDSSGFLYLGTDDGLYRFDPQSGGFEKLTVLSTVPDKRIFAVLPDDAGNLWLQTLNALIKFSLQTGLTSVYDRHNGWIQNGVYEMEWRNAFQKLASGEMVFGGANGITIFDPDEIKDNPTVPPVYITNLRISYQPVEVSRNYTGKDVKDRALLRHSLLFTRQLTLRHSENTFSFDFAALDYTRPEANQYAYILEGFQEEWVNNGSNNRATFTNIPPGEYTFRVKGSNNDGVWNEEGATIRITILPPWWRTTTAYLAYLTLLLALLYGLRRFEMNRIRLRNQLRMSEFEAQKLQELDSLKSRFFANISHEFRTPLTLVLGPLDDMLNRAIEPASKSNLQLMQRNAQRLLQLINQLLDLSRLESGRMTLQVRRGDFIATLRGIVMSFASLAEQKHVRLAFEAHPDLEKLPETYFDRDKIEKIFFNLLSNAIKFTQTGGKVVVELQLRNTQYAIQNRGVLSGSEFVGVEIHVRDTGIGIAEELLPHIFDRFYQVDSTDTRQYQGTGIGLALVKELVEIHKGSIRVSSKLGEGTEFTVFLPISKSAYARDEIAAAPGIPVEAEGDISREIALIEEAPPIPREAKSIKDKFTPLILIVDDHADVRHYIRVHLREFYTIIDGSDGEAGLRLAIERIPDLIISDVMMPGMDGFQLCERLKTDPKTSHIPVILLTARAGEENIVTGLETGADDYLIKPFNPRELQARVKNLIAQRRKLRERFRKEGLLIPDDLQLTSTEQAFLEKLRTTLEANIAEEDFGIDTLCRELAMGKRQLQRKIRALTDQSPTELIRATRLERAKYMLEQKAGTVSEIAFEVGFNNLSYFSRSFRERFGISPSEFVKQ